MADNVDFKMADNATYKYKQADDIREGDYMVLNEKHCKVVSVTKNGASCKIIGTPMSGGPELEDTYASSQKCKVFDVNETKYQIQYSNNVVKFFSEYGKEIDLTPPEGFYQQVIMLANEVNQRDHRDDIGIEATVKTAPENKHYWSVKDFYYV